MQTVETIIEKVYGDDAAAARELGVGRTAVSNWKTWGRFPTRLVVPIWRRAKERGLEIEIETIPTFPEKSKVSG